MTPRQLERVFRLNMMFARRQCRKLRGKRLSSGTVVDRRFIRKDSSAFAMMCVRHVLGVKAFVPSALKVKA